MLKLYGDGDNAGWYQAVLLRLNLALLMSGGAMIQDVFIRMRAKQLYWQGYTPADIAQLMGINQNTIYSWKKRDEWDATPRSSGSPSPLMHA
ncbi:terminase gpP N-terminus-related DNA-binding protein [Escherichia coli]|uniref:terminase gpP N-terminus-related DNA-binding protein n=1 Tax=Escherichia coli TaxID=562 RepID=UPI0011134E1D|nr:helix-turn-helix domain-containing protein [Escherichia coli]